MSGKKSDDVVTAPAIAEDAPLGRRERKRLQTRSALIRAAMELFDQRGFDEVTVADIAERLIAAVTEGVAHQLGVDPGEDVRPYLVASMWVGAFSWYRDRALHNQEAVGDPAPTIDAVVKSIRATSSLLLDID
jgi:Bacterial regulatory proteins, tetR family